MHWNHWNHRVVNAPSENGGDDLYIIKEVFYDDNDQLMGYTTALPMGDNLTELRRCLERMLAALDEPVLHENRFDQP